MFKNYLIGEKYQYFDLYIDIYTKKINSIIKDNIIIFKNSDIQKIESIIKEKIKNNINKSLNIYIYIPILLSYPEKLKKIDFLKKYKEINK